MRTIKIFSLTLCILLICKLSISQISLYPLQKLSNHTSKINEICFSKDGKYFASAAFDWSVCVYKVEDKQFYLLNTLSLEKRTIYGLDFSPDNKFLAVTDDVNVLVYENRNNNFVKIKTLSDNDNWVQSVSFSPDGQYLATGCWDKKINIYQINGNDFKLINTLKENSGSITDLQFSDDGSYLFVTDWDKSTSILKNNGRNFSLLTKLVDNNGWVNKIDLSFDDTYFATASEDKTINIYQNSTFSLLQSFSDNKKTTTDISFSINNKFFATSSEDGFVNIYQNENSKFTLIESIDTESKIYSVKFSPIDNIIAWADKDGNITVKEYTFSEDNVEVVDNNDNSDNQNTNQETINIDDNSNSNTDNVTDNSPNNNENKDIVDIEEISDLLQNLPENKTNKNRFALIIGNEDYDDLIKVDYAINDAEAFKQYAISVLGVPEDNIIYEENCGVVNFNKIIKNASALMNENRELFVYYSGHGSPDENKEAYLLPVDVTEEMVEDYGIKLSDFYTILTQNNPEKVTIFIDACFSGGGRNGLSEARSGIKIKPSETTIAGNIIVFAASSGDEVAQKYDDKEHGLFTYFLLKNLKETSGEIDYGELADLIYYDVHDKSLINTGLKEQTPKVGIGSGAENWEDWEIIK